MVDKNSSTNSSKKQNTNPYRRIFFSGVNVLSLLLLLFGFVGALLVMATPGGNPYESIAVFISIIWCVIFLQYFVWAIYYYNINYGLTDLDWERKFKAREEKAKGIDVAEEDLKVPSENPYKDETFGLPGGTVRGMIAFTLLFGAVALMLVSMGMDGDLDENSFFRDHFEFFKTAFLMMIAFYFGDSSLKTLSKRWPKNGQQESGDGNGVDNPPEINPRKLLQDSDL